MTSENSPPTDCAQMELFDQTSELMCSAVDSRARTSAPQAKVLASLAPDPGSGRNMPVSLASYDHDTSSWRTCEPFSAEGWAEFSGTWPQCGMMRNGELYPLPPWAPLTSGSGCGLSDIRERMWPTPTLTGNHNRKGASATSGDGLATAVALWPTPTSRDWKDGSAKSCANVPVNGLLGRAVHMWPTPRASRQASSSTACTARRVQEGRANLGEMVTTMQGGGLLNPTWVEWLLGYPAEWTALEPSETASFLKSRRSSAAQSSKRKRIAASD